MADPLAVWLAGLLSQRVIDELKVVESILTRAINRSNQMSAQLEALKLQVEQNKSVEQSALTLIVGLHDQLVAAGEDPAALALIKDDLKTSADALAAAVAANTIAAG